MKFARQWFSLFLAVSLILIPRSQAAREERPVVMATTTMIGSMLELLAGDELEIRVLIPPGSCPGHFDFKPGDAVHLSQANLIIRHDFQSYLDQKLVSQNPLLRVAMLESPGHAAGDLVIPSNHLAALKRVKDILENSYSRLIPVLEKNFALARFQVEEAEQEARLRIEEADFGGVKVLASFRQADFVRWAGLEVVDEFTNSPDELSVLRLKEIVETAAEQNIAFIAGNLHSGGKTVARAISAETGLPVCILSNFPGTNERNTTYTRLLLDNIGLLTRVRLESADP